MADQVTVAAPEMENQEVVTILKSELVRLKECEKKLKDAEAKLEKHSKWIDGPAGDAEDDDDEIDDTDATDGEEVDDVDAEKEVKDA